MAGENPDIIHAHEWQLSAVPMLYWWGPHHPCSHAGMSGANMYCLSVQRCGCVVMFADGHCVCKWHGCGN